MKTAEKILIIIGAVTVALLSAAAVTHFIFSGKKKYYPVSKRAVEFVILR